MPGAVIGKSLNLGYAGKISRNGYNTISSRFVKSILDGNGAETLPNVEFGAPVVLNTDNTYSKFGTSGAGVSAATAANFAGIAVAEVKQVMTYNYGSNASQGVYLPGQPMDVIAAGTVTVFCKEGTPTAGGPVYVVTVAATTGGVSAVGDLIAQATPAGTGSPAAVQLTNCQWTTGKKDTSGITEMTITSINKA